MDTFRVRCTAAVVVEELTRVANGLSPVGGQQELGATSVYGLSGAGSTLADQFVYLIEEVTAGAPRVVDLNGSAEKNPVFEAATLAKAKTLMVVNLLKLADRTTAGNDLEVVFGIEAAAAYLRCVVAGDLTFTLKPGETLYFDHPAGVTLGSTTPEVTVRRPSGATAGTKGRFAMIAIGEAP